MKRWHRALLLIPLLLVAGMAVNVVVAWVLVGAPESWTSAGGQREDLKELRAAALARCHELARLGAPESEHYAYRVSAGAGRGWTIIVWSKMTWSKGHQEEWNAIEFTAGWPRRSMSCVMTSDGVGQHYLSSLDPMRFLLPNDHWFAGPRNRLPLKPVPVGFAVNTLFYTVILALPLSVFPIRRRLRARRGRCPKCGYDLAGLGGGAAEGGATCPECGAGR